MIKLTCDRQILNEALTSASRVVSTRAAQEYMKGILLEAADGILTITGSDTDISLKTAMDANVSESGSCVIEARILSDIVRRLSGDEVVLEVDAQYQAVIRCDLSEFSIMSLPADKYSVIPDINETRSLTLAQPVLKRLLGLTSFAVSQNDTRGIHTGVLFDIETEKITLVALDGHRMSIGRAPLENGDPGSFVVHAGPLDEIERILSSDEEDNVQIRVGPRHVCFELGQTAVTARLLEGEFLKYKNSIPVNNSFKSRIDVKGMIQSVERVSLLINDKLKNPIRMAFEGETLRLSCITGLGKASDSLTVEPGGTLEIGFNNRYILDALRHCPEEELLIECNGPLTPFLFLPAEGDEYLFLILPVRLSVE
ncbi:MAG: DNA polymerase III subunit beta [Oscillospiraceae bacterium]|jgi:DNA polymerase-3 subunit beta|nr:DNA polymerase III subunit beta [Oscillospiraceae bacterium]